MARTRKPSSTPVKGGEQPLDPHQCKICKKRMARPSDMGRHVLTHTLEKPHVCHVCDKGFSQKTALKTHLNIHSKETPYECPWEDCPKKFSDPSVRTRHVRDFHEKRRDYKCEICRALGLLWESARKDVHRAHMKTKHGVILISTRAPPARNPHTNATKYPRRKSVRQSVSVLRGSRVAATRRRVSGFSAGDLEIASMAAMESLKAARKPRSAAVRAAKKLAVISESLIRMDDDESDYDARSEHDAAYVDADNDADADGEPDGELPEADFSSFSPSYTPSVPESSASSPPSSVESTPYSSPHGSTESLDSFVSPTTPIDRSSAPSPTASFIAHNSSLPSSSYQISPTAKFFPGDDAYAGCVPPLKDRLASVPYLLNPESLEASYDYSAMDFNKFDSTAQMNMDFMQSYGGRRSSDYVHAFQNEVPFGDMLGGGVTTYHPFEDMSYLTQQY